VHSLLLGDRWMTVQMIADELQIGKTSIYSILMEDLEMRKICAKIVPKISLLSKSCEENNVALTGKPSKVQVGAAWAASGGHGNDYSRIDNVAQRLEGK
jgi:uncharacterized protein (DUF736 family)